MNRKLKRLFKRSSWIQFVELTRAQFAVKDHNSMLGLFWSFLGPLSMLVVMYFIFSARFGRDVYAYPLYLLSGIVIVSFFITTTTIIMQSITLSIPLIINTTLPREVLLVSSLNILAYKFLIELAFCAVISLCYNIFPFETALLLPPLIIAFLGLVLGVGVTLSMLYCIARDIEHIWAMLSQLLFFVTPLFYQLNAISPVARKIIFFANPLTPFVISMRGLLMGGLDYTVYAYSIFLGIAFFAFGCWAFYLLEEIAVERA